MRPGTRLRRRDVLAGAVGLAAAGSTLRAQSQIPRVNEVRALRLTRGLLIGQWLEGDLSDSEAIRRRLSDRFQPEDFAAIRALGFNHVRVALDPRFLAPRLYEHSDPTLDKERLGLLDNAMSGIVRSGLAIVLVNHMTPEMKEKCAAEAKHRDDLAQWWHGIARHIASHDQYHRDGTFFELFNEPGPSFEEPGLYRAALEQFLVEARRAAPDHTIIVGGNDWNSVDGIAKSLRTPLDDANLIYTFHFYQPLEFTWQGLASGGPQYAKLRNVPWDVDAGAISDDEISQSDPAIQPTLREYNQQSHRRADLLGPFSDMRRWCDQHDQVGWLGEFGVHSEGAHAQHRIAWTHHVRELAEEHKFGWSMAEARGAFGLFLAGDARPLRPDRPLLRALGL